MGDICAGDALQDGEQQNEIDHDVFTRGTASYYDDLFSYIEVEQSDQVLSGLDKMTDICEQSYLLNVGKHQMFTCHIIKKKITIYMVILIRSNDIRTI